MSLHPLSSKQIVFIGAGNMAEAIVSGLIDSGVCPPQRIRVTDVSATRLEHFPKTYGVQAIDNNALAVRDADVVVLAVKPQMMDPVLDALRPPLPDSALVISIAAGLRCATLEAGLKKGTRLVRVMPNTPALVKRGIAGVSAGTHATPADVKLGLALLELVGEAVEVTEDQLDAITAVSGSGPAYVFYLMEAMIAAGESLGLDPELARRLVLATTEGSARLIRETGQSADELRRRVTSKGGTTAAAIATFDEAEVGLNLAEGVRAAHRRSIELSKGGKN